jgi:hypothetical protein
MKAYGDEAQRTGRILSKDAVDGGAELDRKLQDLTDTLSRKATQAVLDYSDEILAAADFVLDDLIPAIGELMSQIASFVEGMQPAIDALTRFISLGAAAAGLKGGEVAVPSTEEQARLDADTAPRAGESDPSNSGLFYVDDNGDVQEYGTGAPTPVLPGITAPTPPIVFTPSSGSTGRGGGGKKRGGGGGRSSRDDNRDLEDAIRDYERILDVLDPLGRAAREYANQEEAINRAVSKGLIDREQANILLNQASVEMQRAALEASGLASVFDTVQSSMEDAFMSMVDGTMSAKDAFKSMAANIIKELYRVLVVQRLVGSFSSGGGGILGALAGAFKIGAASGRPVYAGSPYTVGEHGREQFVPEQNGRILSTAQAKSALAGGGGGGVVVHQTINVTTGVQQTVRAEIKTLMPQIANASKAAVLDAKRRGGAYGQGF